MARGLGHKKLAENGVEEKESSEAGGGDKKRAQITLPGESEPVWGQRAKDPRPVGHPSKEGLRVDPEWTGDDSPSGRLSGPLRVLVD